MRKNTKNWDKFNEEYIKAHSHISQSRILDDLKQASIKLNNMIDIYSEKIPDTLSRMDIRKVCNDIFKISDRENQKNK